MAASATDAQPLLELKDVTVCFGHAKHSVVALQSANLTIGRGEFVALVGPKAAVADTILSLREDCCGPPAAACLSAMRAR